MQALLNKQLKGSLKVHFSPFLPLLVYMRESWLLEKPWSAVVRFSHRIDALQRVVLDFVLARYVGEGVEELDQEKLTPLLRLRYQNSITDALADLGQPEVIGQGFAGFQKYLFQPQSDA